ncbi:unnamed protein product [Callosobruchus maculatus]|uniref:Uncharacterized protein n=1 Tax=Callosobruchus maculatus TaxID=64391 RepID=A0A653D829_CALMS|nr:unnamed protein product [Callosobruchus maculatus]
MSIIILFFYPCRINLIDQTSLGWGRALVLFTNLKFAKLVSN